MCASGTSSHATLASLILSFSLLFNLAYGDVGQLLLTEKQHELSSYYRPGGMDVAGTGYGHPYPARRTSTDRGRHG